jgi:hypothetical protein
VTDPSRQQDDFWTSGKGSDDMVEARIVHLAVNMNQEGRLGRAETFYESHHLARQLVRKNEIRQTHWRWRQLVMEPANV